MGSVFTQPLYAVLVRGTDGDVLLFESVEKAAGYMEPVDVESGDVYVSVVDTRSQVFLPVVRDAVRFGPLRIRIPEVRLIPGEHDEEVLRSTLDVLKTLLVRRGASSTDASHDGEQSPSFDVVGEVIRRFGWST